MCSFNYPKCLGLKSVYCISAFFSVLPIVFVEVMFSAIFIFVRNQKRKLRLGIKFSENSGKHSSKSTTIFKRARVN